MDLDWLMSDVNEKLFLSNIDINDQAVSVSPTDMSNRISWLIVQICRDFYCHQVNAGYFSRKSAHLYRRLSISGDAYLPTSAVWAMLVNLIGGDNVDLGPMRIDLNLMKDYAQKIVADIVINESMLKPEEAGIEYLTCTRVEDDELPWAVHEDMQ
jgi:hypothetical protein